MTCVSGPARTHAAGGLEPVDLRHLDVDDGHLGLVLDDELDRRVPVARGADHLEAFVVIEQECECVDEQAVVVDDDHPHGCAPEVPGQGSSVRSLPETRAR